MIGNALKYSEGDLTIVLTPDAKVTFENPAPSLTPLTVSKLFDKYYTVNDAEGSTGLGFSIAKELIENEGKSGSNGGSESTGSKVMIGIMITEVDDSVAQQYGYTHGGLLVRSVTSPQASMSGLEQGDIIYKAEGKTVKTQDDLTKILSKKKAGDKLKLTVARDNGRTEELTTVLISE